MRVSGSGEHTRACCTAGRISRQALGPLRGYPVAIVPIGSTAADRGVEGFGAYVASQAAVRSFTRTWSNELEDRGIRVNVVSPAWIETPGATAAFGDEETARIVKEKVAAAVPTGRHSRGLPGFGTHPPSPQRGLSRDGSSSPYPRSPPPFFPGTAGSMLMGSHHTRIDRNDPLDLADRLVLDDHLIQDLLPGPISSPGPQPLMRGFHSPYRSGR